MVMRLPNDFKEFIALLEQNNVQYLLIGGYAVGIHGYPRATGDMDIFIAFDEANVALVVQSLHEFGFAEASADLLNKPSSMIRMGVPPNKLEITNFIDGVNFDDCFKNRVRVKIDGLELNLIGLADLRQNKKASGRNKDLADLDNLPEI
jgi:predicted nucleotidyltransferase